ncbi:hypothetical protein EVAR_74059_1 [Eumeta japonica]|uniref:Uncharacterized protein n=1 Tax=Eumeta variegata TaxID=151549 RepID=A0A4C1SQZ8_EUMVA|nr:hypothetical protein EVAR_74059_1 [Eumeta japonica]
MNKQYRKAYKTVIMRQPAVYLRSQNMLALEVEQVAIMAMAAVWQWINKIPASAVPSITSYGNEQQTKETNAKGYDRTNNTGNVATNGGNTRACAELEYRGYLSKSSTELTVTEPSTSKQASPTPAQTHNINNEQTNTTTNIIAPRTIKRIALGGDIILEEEEEEEEEMQKENQLQESMKINHLEKTNSLKETEEQAVATAPVASSMILTQRPTPVYVNASVLQQKKNPSYGQNINFIPDNKNSNKLLTKPKL